MGKEFYPKEMVSGFENYCTGAFGKDCYVTTLTLGGGTTVKRFSHRGSTMLDGIYAFDKAEVEDAYIGQINMITVSSFCGREGFLWGYDLVRSVEPFRHPEQGPKTVQTHGQTLPVYDASPLKDATRALFGTSRDKHFPIRAGSLVPCAEKTIVQEGPAILMVSFAVGVSYADENNAYLFMEDAASFTMNGLTDKIRSDINEKLAASVLEVGRNHGVAFDEILMTAHKVVVQKGEIGCALLAIPYISLAKQAVYDREGNPFPLEQMSLEEWQRIT